ncbi:MAG: hypothetical protein AAF591_14050 [Verrucomicrobiota bacterium]
MNTSQSILQGALRFGAVSLLAYSIWAFGGRMGTIPLYSSIAVAFLALSGLFLYPLIPPPHRLRRAYAIILPGFATYALLWCAGWFLIRGSAGEILGSAAGLAAFAAIITAVLKPKSGFLPAFAVLFLFHTLGYTIGGMCYYAAHGKGVLTPLLESHITLGRLLWGLFHGLGFGAGLGFAFHQAQNQTS